MYAGLVPLQFVFHLGNHQLSVVQNGLPVDYPLSASFWRKHYFREVAETAGIMRPQAAIRLRSQKLGALGHLSSCYKVMIPDSARRAFSVLLRQDGVADNEAYF